MKEQPNLIIFRGMDEGEDMMFVEVPFLDGKLHAQGTKFTINSAEDTYLSMGFQHIVLAKTTAEGSLDLCRFSLTNGKNDAVVYQLHYDDLSSVVRKLVQVYNDTPEPE